MEHRKEREEALVRDDSISESDSFKGGKRRKGSRRARESKGTLSCPECHSFSPPFRLAFLSLSPFANMVNSIGFVRQNCRSKLSSRHLATTVELDNVITLDHHSNILSFPFPF